MRCSAEIRVYEDPEKVLKCFKAEEEAGNRSTLKVKKQKDHVSMIIDAKDEAAMRAAFNSAMKGLTIYEKMRGL